jgi:predicted site-specific integrase-resolvase
MEEEKMKMIEILAQKYPVLLNFQEVGEILRVRERTIRNWQSRGKLPFPTFKINGAVRVKLTDLVEFIENGNRQEIKKRRRGRPTKAEQMERQENIEENN